MIVIELCSNGNLRDYLRNCRPTGLHQTTVMMEQRLAYAQQIASGMAHLEGLGVVHGDLAAFVDDSVRSV